MSASVTYLNHWKLEQERKRQEAEERDKPAVADWLAACPCGSTIFHITDLGPVCAQCSQQASFEVGF